MHPIAVDGSSVLSAFLSHHQPPSPTYRHQHTLVPSSPRPVTKEQLSVSHCDRMQLLSQKRCYLFSVDMTVARTYKPRLAITLFSFISTHSVTCVRRTHLGVENDPTNKIRCCRLFLNAPLELLEATSQPEVSKQDIHNDFDTVVLISLLILRTPPNVRRSILIVYRFIYASVKPQDEQNICL